MRSGPQPLAVTAFLAAGLLLAVLIGLALRQPETAAPRSPVPASTQLTAAEVIGRFRDQTQWSLRVRSVENAGDVVHLGQIEDGLFYRAGQPEWRVEAPSGVWYRTTNDLDLAGGVVLTQVSGEAPRASIRTEKLAWQAAENRLIASGLVEMRRGDDRVWAGSLVVSVKERWVRLEGDVRLLRGEPAAPDAPPGQEANMQALVYEMDTGRIEMIGPVRFQFHVAR